MGNEVLRSCSNLVQVKSISSDKKIHHGEMMGEEDREGKKTGMLEGRKAQEGRKGGETEHKT